MIVEKFLQWSKHAKAIDRARAANALGRAYIQSNMSEDEARAAEAAMIFLLDDPSPLVRLGLAEAICFSPRIPRAVIMGLAGDQLDIAGLVVSCSPVLKDADLVDFVADSRPGLQLAVAMRRNLSSSVCAAVAEVGCSLAVSELLQNRHARIASVSFDRIWDRYEDDADVRSSLIDRDDLPCDVRHALIFKVGSALAGSRFVSSVVGTGRVTAVTASACERAIFTLTDNVRESEIPALVEHLRIRGDLSPAFLMHVLCKGNIEFFAAAIAGISGMARARVRAILVDGRRASIASLFNSCGIQRSIGEVFVQSTLLWRDAAMGKSEMSPDQIMNRHMQIMRRQQGDKPVAELFQLVERMNLEYQRRSAKEYALSIAAA
ncbi:DUF2336 domain-containing protein [Hoeflea sp. WL0058]|uniref:DUF2336 domain-containing protein n=1 Tax=Flavimaribacter sediminis TaxID=2865987 RepID=A0AAE3CZ81_9HYPH|nr:DUF2336 domain-containing protein [Flavimaribacter sediminis]MBW8637055.1 DUF2336 domain-containing protein [Flavimaribacter sediminis]